MAEDTFELAADPATETGHCENTDLTAAETRSPSRRELHGGYENSRFNAMRHGVLSVHTVLPWEDKAEYETLLNGLVEEYAPHGPTEVHLIEEIAGVIWRKRRLRLAEAASYWQSLADTAGLFSYTLTRALIQVEPIVDALIVESRGTTEDLLELKKRQASAQKALEILSTGITGAYEAALAELDELTCSSWQEQLAQEPEDLDDDEDPDEDVDRTRPPQPGLRNILRTLSCRTARGSSGTSKTAP